MAQKEIMKINRFSLAKITAVIYGLVGFLSAIIVAILVVGNLIRQSFFQGSVVLVALFNLGAGLLLGVLTALLAAAFGWVMGFIAAGIYNWAAGRIGGIKIELKDEADAQ